MQEGKRKMETNNNEPRDLSYGELAELDHAGQVSTYGWCSCEQGDRQYDDCPWQRTMTLTVTIEIGYNDEWRDDSVMSLVDQMIHETTNDTEGIAVLSLRVDAVDVREAVFTL